MNVYVYVYMYAYAYDSCLYVGIVTGMLFHLYICNCIISVHTKFIPSSLIVLYCEI